MFKICKIIIISITLCIIIPFICRADNYVKVNDLIEKGKEFDNKTVIIKAETIGEPLQRGEFTWVNVNDGTNVIGLWIKSSEVEKIRNYGNYKEKGDMIEATGVFSRNCNEHGGDVDIHADSVKVLDSGYSKNHIINKERTNIAIIMLLFTIALLVIYYKKLEFKKSTAD